jgi:hypothetical protein
MQGLAKEQLLAGILKWLPQGHIVIVEPPPATENSFVIGWMNAYGATSIAEVTFEQNLLDDLQKVIEAHDENLLEKHMDTIEDHVLALAAAHDDGAPQSWHLTSDALASSVSVQYQGNLIL